MIIYSTFSFFCEKLKRLWKEVQTNIHLYIHKNIKLNVENVLLGVLPTGLITQSIANKANLLILLGKLSVSKFKYGNGIDPVVIFENESMLRNLTYLS